MKNLYLLIIGLLIAQVCSAQSGERWYYNIDEDNIAIGGYDPVAYIRQNKAVPGKDEWQSVFQDVVYKFASKANKREFMKNPEQYQPAYGGWCAFFMGIDSEKTSVPRSRVKPDPTNFMVHQGKVYLIYKGGQNFKEQFEKNLDSILKGADEFWDTRKSLANLHSGLPEGMNPEARMELMQWLPFLGRWKAEAKWWTDTTGTTWGGTTAEWDFNFGFKGFCIIDNWWPDNDGIFSGTTSGPAIRGYDPSNGEWHMTFIPVNQPRQSTWMMTANFIDETTLEGSLENVDFLGRPFVQKVIFKAVSNNEFIWRAHRSYDGGKTWLENVMMTDCVRVESTN